AMFHSLFPVLRRSPRRGGWKGGGEGLGALGHEGQQLLGRHRKSALPVSTRRSPLSPTLSPEYREEGAMRCIKNEKTNPPHFRSQVPAAARSALLFSAHAKVRTRAIARSKPTDPMCRNVPSARPAKSTKRTHGNLGNPTPRG